MHAIAVFHHSVVNKFCSTESKLIKHGCIILVAGAGGLCADKGQGDEGTSKGQGSRAGTAHHMPREGQRQSQVKGE